MLNRRYPVKIGLRTYRLANTLKAWLLFERKTGRQMGDIAGGPDIIRAMLWALLATEHPEITEAEIGEMSGDDLRELLRAAELCIRGGFPEVTAAPVATEPQRLDWHELWAIGRFDLGLSEEEFWNLSPRQFHHLTLRFKEQCKRQCGVGEEEQGAPVQSAGSIVDKVLAMKAQMGK